MTLGNELSLASLLTSRSFWLVATQFQCSRGVLPVCVSTSVCSRRVLVIWVRAHYGSFNLIISVKTIFKHDHVLSFLGLGETFWGDTIQPQTIYFKFVLSNQEKNWLISLSYWREGCKFWEAFCFASKAQYLFVLAKISSLVNINSFSSLHLPIGQEKPICSWS